MDGWVRGAGRGGGDTSLTMSEPPRAAAAAGSLEYWTAENRLQQQPAIFNAFYFRDLLLLDSVRKNSAYRDAIEQYAQSTWDSNRDPETGLFHFQPSGGGGDNPIWTYVYMKWVLAHAGSGPGQVKYMVQFNVSQHNGGENNYGYYPQTRQPCTANMFKAIINNPRLKYGDFMNDNQKCAHYADAINK